MSDIHKQIIKLCDSVLGNYYLGKSPEEELAKKIKEALALLPQDAKELQELDCRCKCKDCEARTQETYRLSVTCSNCGWSGVALLRKGDRPSWQKECPHCGRNNLHYGTDPVFAKEPAPSSEKAPADCCPSCGTPWTDHLGIAGTCAQLAAERERAETAERERDAAEESARMADDRVARLVGAERNARALREALDEAYEWGKREANTPYPGSDMIHEEYEQWREARALIASPAPEATKEEQFSECYGCKRDGLQSRVGLCQECGRNKPRDYYERSATT